MLVNSGVYPLGCSGKLCKVMELSNRSDFETLTHQAVRPPNKRCHRGQKAKIALKKNNWVVVSNIFCVHPQYFWNGLKPPTRQSWRVQKSRGQAKEKERDAFKKQMNSDFFWHFRVDLWWFCSLFVGWLSLNMHPPKRGRKKWQVFHPADFLWCL